MPPLWGGRFENSPDEAMLRFSTSLHQDSRLWRYDIAGSLAHVRMLARCGILGSEDAAAIESGLAALQADLETGKLTFQGAPDEDIHSFVERVLTERLGPVAGKLHTARSRNDQVALDMRMYLKDALDAVRGQTHQLQGAFLDRARDSMESVMPGYTHLQRAQPVLLAHHLLAYFWMLQRDEERLEDAHRRADVMPLGAAALAGTPFNIDRGFVARQLGFSTVSNNSMDTVSDRDHLIESVSALALVMVHLSRLAEEMVLWSSSEFGFVSLSDNYTTGSSIMPQKKNPDSMELVRGKSARVTGNLMTLLALVKSLPLTYNRDLQEDKAPVFESFDETLASLEISRGVIGTAVFNARRMREVAAAGFSTATDAADHLVMQGVPFREAHHIVGRIVTYCEQNKKTLQDLTLMEWQGVDPRFGADVLDRVDLEGSLKSRTSFGGTAPQRVLEQLDRALALWRQSAATRPAS